jgi:CheY-like chemotaxis protein
MIRGIPPPASRTGLRKTRVQLAAIARLDEDRGVSFGVDVRARSRKAHKGLRALLGKAPDAREVGDRLVRLAKRAFKGLIVDATTRRDYRMMLLDLKLPKLSGAEVLARLARKPTKPASVIVISGADSGDVRSVANNGDVNAILRKGYAITNADVIFPALAALARA